MALRRNDGDRGAIQHRPQPGGADEGIAHQPDRQDPRPQPIRPPRPAPTGPATAGRRSPCPNRAPNAEASRPPPCQEAVHAVQGDRQPGRPGDPPPHRFDRIAGDEQPGEPGGDRAADERDHVRRPEPRAPAGGRAGSAGRSTAPPGTPTRQAAQPRPAPDRSRWRPTRHQPGPSPPRRSSRRRPAARDSGAKSAARAEVRRNIPLTSARSMGHSRGRVWNSVRGRRGLPPQRTRLPPSTPAASKKLPTKVLRAPPGLAYITARRWPQSPLRLEA